MKFIKLIPFIFIGFLIIQGCSQPQNSQPKVCTDEFVIHSVTVMNPDNTPADSVQITVTNKESGNTYPCGEYLCQKFHDDSYIIMHDGFLEDLSSTGEIIVVKGKKDSMQFSEEFTFQGGDCHVEKLAGPDTVSLTSN